MSDISRNNIRRAFTTDTSHNNIGDSLYAIVNEMLNGIEDDEIQDTRDFNPFLYRRRRNYTIGRNIDSSSPLFNMINQIFDTSRNLQSSVTQNNNQNTNDNESNENDEPDNEPIIEQITFQVTYPLNFDISNNESVSNEDDNNNNYNNYNNNNNRNNRNNINPNLNDLGSTINSLVTNSVNSAFGISNNMNLFGSYSNNTDTRPFGSTIRSYYSTRSIPYPIDTFSSGGIFQQILSQSLYDESVYKKKISEKGKSQLTHIRFDKNNYENINTSCPINQTDFEDEQYVIQLPCNHMFTPDAINRWLDEKPECPVCRFELDSIEVKREIGIVNDFNDAAHERLYNSNQTRMPHSPIMRPMNNQRYNDNYRQTRMMGRDRIQLNNNSYLDYLYEEIDNNDFQAALILSYRELMDISGGNSNNINDSTNNETGTETENINHIQNDNYDSTIETFETVAAYVSDNMPDIPDASNHD